jgi:hypothetical protein
VDGYDYCGEFEGAGPAQMKRRVQSSAKYFSLTPKALEALGRAEQLDAVEW